MSEFISRTRSYFGESLGRCATCMRQALIAALAACAMFAFAVWAALPAVFTALAGLAALGLGALWLAHVAAFTARAHMKENHAGRCEALGFALRAAAIGAAFSIPVAAWSSKAMAFCGQCTQNSDCGPCCKCINTAPVNSGKVCNECKPK